MDILTLIPLWVWIGLGLAAIVAAYFYLGPKAATVLAAGAALLLAYMGGRRGQKTEIENEVAREELEDEIERNERIVAADRAGDAARNVPDDRLREHDPFERR